jgi:hypothetical protein
VSDSRQLPDQGKPAAMIRGTRPVWRLQDAPGPEYRGQFTEPEPLARFYGEYTAARAAAQTWCDDNGYYLSSWSDGDDREAVAREALNGGTND